MRLVLLGRAGSGKGVIAERICPLLGIPQVSVGELLREQVAKKTALGKKAAEFMKKGELVPDEFAFKVLRRRLAKPDTAKGFVLDGFPRDLGEAKQFDKTMRIDAVVYLNVPEKILIKRLSSRVECKKCGRIYNTLFLKPRRKEVCDACGGRLYHREDDKPKAVQVRLHKQWKQTQAVLRFYREKRLVREVDITDIRATPEHNANRVLAALGLKQRL